MGADSFWTTQVGSSVSEAFQKAQDEARHECGHRGYTGTIAEKRDFVVIRAELEIAAVETKLRARYATLTIAEQKKIARRKEDLGKKRGEDRTEAEQAWLEAAPFHVSLDPKYLAEARKRVLAEIRGLRGKGAATSVAHHLMDVMDPRVDDKWGPAGAILVEKKGKSETWLFFGMASS